MFSTLLTQISTFFSKPFLIGAFLPTLFFLVINGAVLGWAYPPFRIWAAGFLQQDGWDQMGGIFRGLLPAFAFSYVLWSVNPALQSIMEGRILPPWLRTLLLTHQYARFRELQEELDDRRAEQMLLRRRSSQWRDSLRAARAEGTKRTASTYNSNSELEVLRGLKRNGGRITLSQLAPIHHKLEAALKTNNPEIEGPDHDFSLDKDHTEFLDLLRYAAGISEARYLTYFAEFEWEFSPLEVRPTKLGNYSESVRWYAQSRYRMDTQMTWSRLLVVIRKQDEPFMATLLDQKGQLDFLIAQLWLTILSTALWLVVLPLLSLETEPFLAVAVTGPVLAYVFHRVAMLNYRSFAELQRTAIDLFRLKLMEGLEFETPANLADERQTWKDVTQALVFRESVNLRYRKGEGPTGTV